jgi:hypothetical protein
MSHSFFINPKPKYFSDILLSKPKIQTLLNENLFSTPAEFEFSGDLIYSLDRDGFSNLNPDCFLSTLMHVNNRGDSNASVTLGSYP